MAIFAPNSQDPCASVLPFPTDLAKDPETGRLNIPFCPTDSPDQIGIKTGLRTLDGYAQGVVATVRFTRALDEASLAAPGAVLLLELATGTPVPLTPAFKAEADNTLYLKPQEPLKERTTYLVVVTRAVLDVNKSPVLADQVFQLLKSREPLVDSSGHSRYAALDDASAFALEPLRAGYAQLFDALEHTAQISREQIASAWTFTTQTGHTLLGALAQRVTAEPAQVVHEFEIAAEDHALLQAAGIPHEALCKVHTGRIQLVNLLTASGTFAPDGAASETWADYLLITPKGSVSCDGGHADAWDGARVAVFVHGLGRCKNDALAMANGLASQGMAVLAVDGPKAGGRMLHPLGDRDLDGCPDQPATPEFIALPGAKPNPFALRDHFRQWGLEVAQIVRAVRAGALEFAGKSGGPQGVKVVGVGHSFGGMAAVLGGSVQELDALVVNAASAELGAVFAPALRAATAQALEAAGVNISTAEGQAAVEAATLETVNAFRWGMEPGDPLYAARAWPGTPVLVQVAAQAEGGPEQALHETATQVLLAEALDMPMDKVVHTLAYDDGGTLQPLCPGAAGVVGALLKPCVEGDPTDPLAQQALARTARLQTQAILFAVTALSGTPVICSADLSVPCAP